jgi:hypothetical protein
MGGGLIQLVAYGSQDIYLTSEPAITFFKTVYKRHTHFAIESVYQQLDGNPDFSGKVSCVIGRNGDLLGSMYLEVQLPNATDFMGDNLYDTFGWIQGVGNYMIDSCTISLGAQQIDEQYGKWMDVWTQLTSMDSKYPGYSKMVGKDPNADPYIPYDVSTEPGNRLYIPLQFWFCRNPGLAIPLVALQYHELKLMIKFENFNKLITASNYGYYVQPDILPDNNGNYPSILSLRLYSTYYFLDTIERRQFSQNAHEYLIEQVQTQSGNCTSTIYENNIKINLNHPTKELIFVFNRNNSYAPPNDFSLGNNIIPNSTPKDFAPLYNFKLMINGHDRFTYRNGEYFRLVQPYEYHTRVPNGLNFIYSYSFAIKPEEHQPSGTCNFSRIDNAYLVFTFRSSNLLKEPNIYDGNNSEDYTSLPRFTVYAPCYNILRIMGGMGGLSYAN